MHRARAIQFEGDHKTGIALHLVDVGGETINTAAAMGRMFPTMMAGFAELELSFFTANSRNKNTRRAYHKAACRFSDWCVC